MAVSAKDVILHLGADPKAFDRGMKDAQRSFKGTLGSFEKTSSAMSTKMKLIWAAIAAAVAVAVTKIVKKIINVGKELLTLGQKSLSLKKSFQSLAQAAGVNFKKILSDMKIATKGTVAEVDMLAAANRMMLLGLDPAIFGEVMEIARRTAKATGQDINYMVESLSMGLGRQSKMILDNLGIIIGVSEAHEWYAATLGKTSAQLTENEKRLAFQTFAMKVARENAEALGEDILTLTEAGAIFTSEWKNLKAFIGEKLVEAIGKVIEKFGGWEKIMEDVHFWVDEKVKPALVGLIDKAVEVGQKLIKSGKEIYDKYLPKLVEIYDYIKDDLIPALIGAYDEIKPKLIQAFKDLAKSLKPVVDRLAELVPQMALLAVEYLPVITEKIGKLVEWFTDLDPRLKTIGGSIVGFGAVLIPVVWIMSKLIGIFKFLMPSLKFLWGILKWIASPILLVTTLWGKLVSIAETLYLVFLSIPEPITKIIAIAIALIAIGILIWKNWDTIKAKAIEIWGAISSFFINLWGTIRTKAIDIWNSARDFFINLWESIKTKVIETWDSIRDFFVSHWENIKSKAIEMWDSIKEFFVTTWESIKITFKDALDKIWAWMLDWIPFLNLIVTEWGPVIIELFRGIWESIKNKAIEIWNSIKVKTIEIWESIKEFFIILWEDIKIRATEIWNSIKEFFVILWEDIRVKVIEVWSSIKDFFVEIWEGIKADFTFALEFVKNLISTAFYFIKDDVIIPVWNSIVDFFGNIWNQIIIAVNTFKDNFLRVWDYIKEGLKSPINAMIGLINSLLSRIESGMNSMISALNRIGFKVPDWFAKIIPGLAGREFKISIPKISIPRIPKLELGGIISKTQLVEAHEGEMFLTRQDQRNLLTLIRQLGARGTVSHYYSMGDIHMASQLMRDDEFIKQLARQVSLIQGKEVML